MEEQQLPQPGETMDTNPKVHQITLESGRTLTLGECNFGLMCEFEDEGYTMQMIADGRMKPFAFLAWLMVRESKENPALSFEEFINEFTMVDFSNHSTTFKAFFQSPLASEGDPATG